MTVQTTTHLNFRAPAREALEFYRFVFEGDLSIDTCGDLGTTQDAAQAEQVI